MTGPFYVVIGQLSWSAGIAAVSFTHIYKMSSIWSSNLLCLTNMNLSCTTIRVSMHQYFAGGRLDSLKTYCEQKCCNQKNMGSCKIGLKLTLISWLTMDSANTYSAVFSTWTARSRVSWLFNTALIEVSTQEQHHVKGLAMIKAENLTASTLKSHMGRTNATRSTLEPPK